MRFLRALIAAYEVLKRDQDVGVAAFAKSAGIPEQWAKSIFNDAPPPNLYWWADRRYRYSLVESADFQRRLGYLASFLFEQKFIEKEVDVSDALDVSVIKAAIAVAKK